MQVLLSPPLGRVEPKVAIEQGARLLCLIMLLYPAINGIFGWITDNAESASLTAMMVFKFQIILPVLAFAFVIHCWLGGISPIAAFVRLPLLIRLAIGFICVLAVINGNLTAANGFHATMRALVWLTAFALGLTVTALISRLDTHWIKLLGISIIASFLLYTVLLIAFVATRADPAIVNWVNAMPGYDNVRHMAYAYAAVYALALGWLAQTDIRKRNCLRDFLFVCLLVFGSVLFWSGSRGGVLAIIIAAAITGILRPHLLLRLIFLLVLSMTIASVVSTLHTVPDVYFGIFRFANHFEGEISQLSSGRTGLWKGALDAIRANPWLGYGEGQMKFVVPEAYNTFVQPHNILLQMWLAWGIPGGTIMLLLMAWGWLSGVRNKVIDNPALYPFFLMLSTLIAHSFIDGSLFHAEPVMLAAIATGVSLSRLPSGRAMVSPAGFEPATY